MGGPNLEVFKVSYFWHPRLRPAISNLATSHFPQIQILGRYDNTDSLQFGMYILFPIGVMYYFGTNLDNRFSVPDFWPKPEQTHKIPFERDEIVKELERIKARNLENKRRREELQRLHELGRRED